MDLSSSLRTDLKKLPRSKLIPLSRAIYELTVRYELRPCDFLYPQPYQEGLWLSKKRERWVLGGNRSGKTENGADFVIEYSQQNEGADVWASSWAGTSIPVQQKKIYQLLPKDESVVYAKYTEQNGFANRLIVFDNGSLIRFKTYDQKADSFQGTSKDLIWNDEEPPEGIYNEQKARLIDRDGIMIVTMTPVKGVTWINHRILKNKKALRHVDVFYWSSLLNKYIDQAALRTILSQYSYKEAIVRESGKVMNLTSGRLYDSYEEDLHRKALKLNKKYPMFLSFDFNVNPFCTLIGQIVPGYKSLNEQDKVINILEAVNTEDCTTRKQCEILKGKLEHWKGRIIIYGDATNPRRTETAKINETNWTIIRNYFPDAEYRVPNFNPPVQERVKWVNAKFVNFINQVGIYFNTNWCTPLETDMEQGVWAPDGKRKDKKSKYLNHNSDTLDYIVSWEFPLKEEAFGTTDLIGKEYITLTDRFKI